jgi:hypothetical protein
LLVTRQGKAIRFQEDTVRPQGRSATGMRGITLKDDEAVVAIGVVRDAADLVLSTAQGYAKRTPLSEFPVQGRGGQGVFALDLSKSKSTGPVVGAVVVTNAQELIFATAKGSSLRVRANDVPRLERGSWGRLVTKSGRGAVVTLKNDQVDAVMVPQIAAKPSGETTTSTARRRAPSAARAHEPMDSDNDGASSKRQGRSAGPQKAAKPEPQPAEAKPAADGMAARGTRVAAKPESQPAETKPAASKTVARRTGKASEPTKPEPQPAEARSSASKPASRGASKTAEPTPQPSEDQAVARSARDTTRRARRPAVTKTPRRTR